MHSIVRKAYRIATFFKWNFTKIVSSTSAFTICHSLKHTDFGVILIYFALVSLLRYRRHANKFSPATRCLTSRSLGIFRFLNVGIFLNFALLSLYSPCWISQNGGTLGRNIGASLVILWSFQGSLDWMLDLRSCSLFLLILQFIIIVGCQCRIAASCRWNITRSFAFRNFWMNISTNKGRDSRGCERCGYCQAITF